MNPSRRLLLRPFAESDAEAIAALLRTSPSGYLQFFHPFAFEAATITALLACAKLDQWFVLSLEQDGVIRPAGFYRLRGLDEGFAEPMYGVFIAAEFAGLGLGRLTLAHAEAQCRLNGWPALLLKVNPENRRAHRLYEKAGFHFLRPHPSTGEQVLVKQLLC